METKNKPEMDKTKVINVFYLKSNSDFRRHETKPITLAQLNENYAKVFTTSVKNEGDNWNRHFVCGLLFDSFNNDMDNPLATPAGQEKIKSLGVRHTSMSVGDIIQFDGVYYFCAQEGWDKLSLDLKKAEFVGSLSNEQIKNKLIQYSKIEFKSGVTASKELNKILDLIKMPADRTKALNFALKLEEVSN